MALVTMAFRRSDLHTVPEGSGFLVPPVDGHRIKAATFAGHKWGWIGDADPDLFVLRTSIGRYGDDADLERDDAELVALSLADLRRGGRSGRPAGREHRDPLGRRPAAVRRRPPGAGGGDP